MKHLTNWQLEVLKLCTKAVWKGFLTQALLYTHIALDSYSIGVLNTCCPYVYYFPKKEVICCVFFCAEEINNLEHLRSY